MHLFYFIFFRMYILENIIILFRYIVIIMQYLPLEFSVNIYCVGPPCSNNLFNWSKIHKCTSNMPDNITWQNIAMRTRFRRILLNLEQLKAK